MQTIKLFHNSFYTLLAFIVLAGVSCKKRDVSELEAATFPVRAEVFIDDFTPDLTYDAFGGSDVKAFDIDRKETYNGTAASMRFAVPDENSPLGAYAGGTFKSRSGRDLSGFNALTFYIKASAAVNIGTLGFGNDLGENKFIVTKAGLAVNSNWQKVILPIPDPSKLNGEKGLFYFSSGPVNGKGYTVWIDEVKYEKVGNIANLKGLIFAGQDRVIGNAETGDKITINGLQASVSLPTGVNQVVNISPYYFTFTSSSAGVSNVDATGLVSVVDAGTATIKAVLGKDTATGSLRITSTGLPVGPTTKSPVPTRDAADVISLFSNAYTNVPVETWNARYQFSNVDEFFIKVEGDDVIRYRNLNFVGIEFKNPTVNASGMSGFHIDIWTPDVTALPNNFKVLLTDLGPNNVFGGGDDKTHEVTIEAPTLASNTWVGIDIPFSAFTGLTTRANLGQMVLSGTLPNVYIDNVYFYKIPTRPTVAAPTPTRLPANVISVFSDAYTNIAGTDFNPNWGQATVTTQTSIAGNNTLSYAGLNYQGLQFGSNQNVTSMGFLHIDYYSVNSTGLKVFLISPGPVETPFTLNVPTTGWNSVDIPLSSFSPVALNNLIQMKWEGNGDIYVDNIYFFKNPAPPTVPIVAAPVPTRPAADVLSIFSDTYTNVAGTNFNPDWGQTGFATAGQIAIGGNNILAYPNFNYQGIQLGSNQNVSTYGSLHVDYYSVNSTALRIFLISPPDERSFTLTVPTTGTGWNSVDIPLTAFAGVNLNAVSQFKFDGGDGSKNVYLDNIYFYKGGGGGSCPTPPAGEFIVDGGFEANAGCWELFAFQPGTSATIVTNVSNGGSNSARIKTAQGGNPGIKQTRFGEGVILPNTTYVVKFDVRSDAGDPVANGSILNAFAFSEPANGSPNAAVQHALVQGDANVPSTWTTRTYTFTTAANVEGGLSLLIELVGGGATTTGTIYIDNVSLRKQ
ncbi:MAG TPA: Ig-like domain-containing protein [Lacibacter sp.]|nr:Ig-like domain-containing protein [Lacibacter sp.]HMO90117.1 Ig-like domain-containing protein [Lacibacter sp.]HMP85726.1 Ig-like domain-containing protein [Lacibacter sp.]